MPFPTLNANQLTVPGKGTGKVRLKPGHSMLDWIRLGKQNNLSGIVGDRLNVTEHELAKHNKTTDCWISLRGNVYNVTPYMNFHPGGGPELMRSAGKDGTELFDNIHKWVNAESMLKSCFVGKLITSFSHLSRSTNKKGLLKAESSETSTASTVSEIQDTLRNTTFKSPMTPKLPSYDWSDRGDSVYFELNTKWTSLHIDQVSVEIMKNRQLKCFLTKNATQRFLIYIDLFKQVKDEFKVWTNNNIFYMTMMKQEENTKWAHLGTSLNGDRCICKDNDITYHDFTLTLKRPLSSDANLLELTSPSNYFVGSTLGYHVYLKASLENTSLVNPYSLCCETLIPPSSTICSSEREVDRLFKPYQAQCDYKNSSGNKLYLMVKIYENGSLTKVIGNLKLGDKVALSQPFGSFDCNRLSSCNSLVLCAAGTGVVPMFSLIHRCLQYEYQCEINLLYYMRTENDIYWRNQIDKLSQAYSKFKATFILSQPPMNWNNCSGHISKDHIAANISLPDDSIDTLICICGPTIFTESANRLIKEYGYTHKQIHLFIE